MTTAQELALRCRVEDPLSSAEELRLMVKRLLEEGADSRRVDRIVGHWPRSADVESE